MKPPIGHPMPGLDLTIVLEDEYGTLYHDERGFMWRGPEYVARYNVLKELDPAMTGGWQKLGNWFRTRKANPQYAPSGLEQVIDYTAPAISTATSIGSKVVFGVVLYGVFQIMRARGWKL